jgi:hypothetical protein
VVLSPLYYIIASLGTELAQQAGLRPYWAVGIGYPLALVVTRSLHTWWGLRSGTFHDHHIREKTRPHRGPPRPPADPLEGTRPEPRPLTHR